MNEVKIYPPTRQDLRRAGITICLGALFPSLIAFGFMQGEDSLSENASYLFWVIAVCLFLIGLGVLFTLNRPFKVGEIEGQMFSPSSRQQEPQ